MHIKYIACCYITRVCVCVFLLYVLTGLEGGSHSGDTYCSGKNVSTHSTAPHICAVCVVLLICRCVPIYMYGVIHVHECMVCIYSGCFSSETVVSNILL